MSWLPVVGYENFYEISDTGLVRSLVPGRYFNKILSQYSGTNHGYATVGLSVPQRRVVLVHRLVAQAFLFNPDNLPEVNHMDGNNHNNNVNNLEWCSAKANTRHGMKMGLILVTGEDNKSAKLTEQRAREIRAKYKPRTYSQKRLAFEYSVSPTLISFIVNHKRWTHIA